MIVKSQGAKDFWKLLHQGKQNRLFRTLFVFNSPLSALPAVAVKVPDVHSSCPIVFLNTPFICNNYKDTIVACLRFDTPQLINILYFAKSPHRNCSNCDFQNIPQGPPLLVRQSAFSNFSFFSFYTRTGDDTGPYHTHRCHEQQKIKSVSSIGRDRSSRPLSFASSSQQHFSVFQFSLCFASSFIPSSFQTLEEEKTISALLISPFFKTRIKITSRQQKFH